MPQAAMTAVFSKVFLATVGNYAAAYAAGVLAYIGTAVVITGGLTALSRSLGPDGKKIRGQTEEYGGTIEPRRIIYGQVRTSGLNVIPPIASGESPSGLYQGYYLHQVLAIAGHPCDAISSVFFGKEEIQDGAIGSIGAGSPVGTNDGIVSTGTYADKAWIRRYPAGNTVVDYLLNAASPEWDASHKGQGVCHALITYQYDPAVYETGKPDVSFLVRGKKVFDPRKDPNYGGSGSHDIANSATWEWSSNPALCLADYLMDANLGMGEDIARIDWTTVSAAANICDEVVAVPTGASPQATTQVRYSCNGILMATDRFEDNIEALCTAMLGHCYYSGGKWQIYAGAWSAAAFALDEDDLVGSISVQADIPRKDKYNAVRGQYYDPQRESHPSEFKPRTTAAYETADGERIWREVDFSFCTNEYEAQRNATIIMRRSRNRRSIAADFSMGAFKVRPYETGTLTLSDLGWTNKVVRCTSWEFTRAGLVRLTLIEENESDWDDPAIAEYTYVAGASSPSPAGYVPPAPDSLAVTGVTDGNYLTWTMPGNYVTPPGVEEYEYYVPFLGPTGTYYEILRAPASSPEPSAADSPEPQVIATTFNRNYVDVGAGATTYYYWVRAMAPSGRASAIYPAGVGTPSAGTLPADGTDGLYMSISRPTAAIPCDYLGTPKAGALPITGYVKVYSGATDVTSSCTFIGTATGCTGDVNDSTNEHVTGGKGYYVVSVMTGNTAELLITAIYNNDSPGAQIVTSFNLSKALDGAASASGEDTSISDITWTSYASNPAIATVDVACGPNGTISAAFYGDYKKTVDSGGTTVTAKIQYREKNVGASWVDFGDGSPLTSYGTGSSAVWNTGEGYWEFGNISIADTHAGPTTLKLMEFQVLAYCSSTTATFESGARFVITWAP